MSKITANINEVSGNTAEVTLDGDGWGVVVTASIGLDGGYFFEILDAWIVWTNEVNIHINKGLLAGAETMVAVNTALAEWYEKEKDENKAREAE